MLMRRPSLHRAVAPLAVLLLLCLVLLNPTSPFVRKSSSENHHDLKRKGGVLEHSTRFPEIPALEEEQSIQIHDTELETVPSGEISGEMEDHVDTTEESLSEAPELNLRMLVDYGPPSNNPNVRPGGPIP